MIFEGLVMISFPIDHYYKKLDDSKKNFYSLCIIAFFLFAFVSIFISNKYLFAIEEFIVLFGLANFIFASPSYILNEKGADVRDSYKDLKRFLNDFSVIKEKTSEMVALWNYYLSYSIALGIEGLAYAEIESFFGNSIYNFNSRIEDYKQTRNLIDNIENEIMASKAIYQKRN